ncbi:uncharacterized protein DNG_03031 [Cephalotrichum gorgonifer]|uniref:Uncharacterized protein n=1 Tax=Cephalotrichum gorgonifer TaxID=2041049 RepID=A0AAE8ST94_9PEZI|nr:uncharacterized protein DNG_03031 [Cephalotrichum gorgonifer]
MAVAMAPDTASNTKTRAMREDHRQTSGTPRRDRITVDRPSRMDREEEGLVRWAPQWVAVHLDLAGRYNAHKLWTRGGMGHILLEAVSRPALEEDIRMGRRLGEAADHPADMEEELRLTWEDRDAPP